jgi:plastocyanin domain-containing protein
MTSVDWLVVAVGIAAIVWVNWYFFVAEAGAVEASLGGSGVQEIGIEVKGGYSPATIRVRRGVPVRLVFDRQETSSCSEEVVLGDFGIRRFLPAFQKTTVELTPTEAGSFAFTCGMGMLHGRLEVE